MVDALVVYESVYGNTRAIAEAVGEGLGGAQVLPVYVAAQRPWDVDLLVVGGPTHMHGLSTLHSRRMAVAAAEEDGGEVHTEPGAGEPGLRAWLRGLHAREGARAAAFDTRLDRSPWVTGMAARGIAKRLRHHGYGVLGTESFLVEDGEGPLADGELDRARTWGAELAAAISPSAPASRLGP